MPEDLIIFIGIAALLSIIAFLGLRARRANRRLYSKIFSPREELSKDALYAAFRGNLDLSQEDLLLILDGAAAFLAVPSGKLRPTDDFRRELSAPVFAGPTLVAQVMASAAVKKLKLKYPGFKASPADLETMADFVAAFARDIAAARKTV